MHVTERSVLCVRGCGDAEPLCIDFVSAVLQVQAFASCTALVLAALHPQHAAVNPTGRMVLAWPNHHATLHSHLWHCTRT